MPEWREIAAMFDTAVKLLGVGAIITAAVVWAIKQAKAMRAPVHELEVRVKACEDRQKADEERAEKQQTVNRLLLESVVAMQRHILDGNHTAALKNCSENIDKYLMSK